MSDKRIRSRISKRRVTFSGGSFKPANAHYRSDRVGVNEILKEKKKSGEPPLNVVGWLMFAFLFTFTSITFGLSYLKTSKEENKLDRGEQVVKERQHAVPS